MPVSEQERQRILSLYPIGQKPTHPDKAEPINKPSFVLKGRPTKKKLTLKKRPTHSNTDRPTHQDPLPIAETKVCTECGTDRPTHLFDMVTSGKNGKAYARKKCKVCVQRQNNNARAKRRATNRPTNPQS